MPSRVIAKSLGAAAGRVPGLRRVPVVMLLSLAEVAVLARDHLRRLTPQERRRLLELIRIGHGRRANLSRSQREELADLVAKLEPRMLAGAAAEKLSPVPLPKRLVRGPRQARSKSKR